jgi:hypothetical protein
MATWKNFEELKVWQKARKLCQRIYDLTNRTPFQPISDLETNIVLLRGQFWIILPKVLSVVVQKSLSNLSDMQKVRQEKFVHKHTEPLMLNTLMKKNLMKYLPKLLKYRKC